MSYLNSKEEQDLVSFIENIEEKIECSQLILNNYEKNKNCLELENRRLNLEYRDSYDFDVYHKYTDVGSLCQYRQSIINKIVENNYLIDNLEYKIKKQIEINNLLCNCNFYINKLL